MSFPLRTAVPLLLFSLPSHAIVNIEAVRAGAGEGLSVEAGLAVGAIYSNTDETRVDADARVDWRSGQRHDFAIAQYAASEVDDVHRERHFVHLRHVHRFLPSHTWEAFTQRSHDDYALLASRTLLGAGWRWYLLEGEDSVALGFGAMTEWETVDLALQQQDRYANRANLYAALRYRLGTETVLGSTTYYQPQFARAGNTRATEELTLDIGLSTHFSLRFNANLTYDSEPEPSIEKTQHHYGLKLTYRLE